MLMVVLTLLSISMGFVSALPMNDTDSSSIDDNSQLNEINEDFLNANDDNILDSAITPEVKISDNINDYETKNVTKGTAVTINVQATANFNYHYDSKVATLYVNGNSIGSTNLLPYNYDDNDRRGSFDYTFTNDGTYDVKVVLEAYQGYSQSYNEATSNLITYIVGNGSSGSETNGTEVSNQTNPQSMNASANMTVWDRNYPENSTIYSNGDYILDVAYSITKSGDGFSDENLEVYINGQSVGRTTPNAYNRLGNLKFDEDNVWTFYVVYTATVNDQTITVTSNSLTVITRNTSNGVNNNTNSTGESNKTDENLNGTGESGNNVTDENVNGTNASGNNDAGEIKIIIRDTNFPDNSTITLNEKYNVLLQYYVTLPAGDLLRNEIILMCNGNAITTISNPIDKEYTSVGGTVFLNETGTYVFSAKYYYYEFMGAGINGDVTSNAIIYKVTISNSTENNNTSSSEDNNNGTNQSGNTNGTDSSGTGSNPSGNTNGTDSSGTGSNPSGNTNGTDSSGTGNNQTNGTDFSGNGTGSVDDINGTNQTGNTNGTDSSGNGTGNMDNSTENTRFSIDATDMTRGYNSQFDYKATFYDKNGNPLKNTEVLFVINGNDYNILTDEYGVAKIVRSLNVGMFQVTIFNPATGDTVTKNVTIVERLTDYNALAMDYSYSASYSIRLFADNANPVGAGESVLITVNNIRYAGITDANGYAKVTIKNNKLIPKTYTVTAEYKGVKVSSKLVVKQILKSKNVSIKKSAKTKKFTATLKTSAGKAIKNKKITFKVKGKTYTAKTNSKGVATIKLTNLKKVGKYSVSIKYLNTSVKNTIMIKK